MKEVVETMGRPATNESPDDIDERKSDARRLGRQNRMWLDEATDGSEKTATLRYCGSDGQSRWVEVDLRVAPSPDYPYTMLQMPRCTPVSRRDTIVWHFDNC